MVSQTTHWIQGHKDGKCNLDDDWYFDDVRKQLIEINQNNEKHHWLFLKRYDEVPDIVVTASPSVSLRLIYSNAPFQAGRLYTSPFDGIQNLSSDSRSTITIDDVRAAELDFKSYSIGIAYNLHRLQRPAADGYMPEEIMTQIYKHGTQAHKTEARNIIKKATIIMLNSSSKQQAQRAVHYMLTPYWQALLYDEEGIKINQLLSRIEKAHHPIADYFYCSKGVNGLMQIEGRIIWNVLNIFTEIDRPAVPIHDSIVCSSNDAQRCRQVMKQVYNYMLAGQFDCVIKRKY